MNLINLVRNLINLKKKVDKKKLPSQGLFYKDDLEITIKRADENDINDYESNFIKDNIGVIIYKVKKIVEKNTILSNGYTFEDLKSIDVVFIFLEIVRFTKKKPILFTYLDEEKGIEEKIEFSTDNFNYFHIDNEVMKFYNNDLKCFEIEGYKYTLPSIGIENCLTNFLIFNQDKPDAAKYNDYFYDFTYFLLDRKDISFNEIENLIQIFNFDIEPEESNKINQILKMFLPMQRYSLIKKGKVIDINSKIDLEKIWK